MIKRDEIIKKLKALINVNGHIIGCVAGSGMTAKYTTLGGADFLLALSAGRFRMMGRSSHDCYMCYQNNNQEVMRLGTNELFPTIKDIPIIFGLNANDPYIHLYDYIQEIQENDFSGIVNFPTVCLIDGQFGEAIQEEGNTFENEVEAIRIAHFLGLFTISFVINEKQASAMVDAGADVVCAHLGFTKGGYMGAGKYISIDRARIIANSIFDACDEINPNVIKMIYGGPANTPIDLQYIYNNTKCQGYIGGSTFDRIPIERAIVNTTKAFKSSGNFDEDDVFTKVVSGKWYPGDYTEFVKQFIKDNYMKTIHLTELALAAHVSQSYLSTVFKKETGCSFTQYLINYRMSIAKKLVIESKASYKEIAKNVGYDDYVQFSKTFTKHVGCNPSQLRLKQKDII